ncbi:glycosyltransferase [Aliarcobacter vitoriensis]|uniref:glycosyltransferase n=1 Tax=Aliarcobacter vitoriensis TaxID=2011099 RepID=UPI003AADA43E
MKKIKLVLSIRSLNVGGAERQFIELVKNIDKDKFEVYVCTMYGGVQENIVNSIENIKYYNLGKKGRYDIFKFYNNYKNILKTINPDVIYSFKEEMNIFSYFCKPKKTKIIWGFRASNMDLSQYGKLSQLLFWVQKKFSSKVDMIIANSNASIIYHKNHGFNMSKSIVIPNGIDVNKFKRNWEDRKNFRTKYELKENDIAIGIVARIDYMKGYIIFTNAVEKLIREFNNVHIFSIGSGSDKIQNECENILGTFNNDRFKWLGNQSNVEKIYSGLDIACSSSFGEGFSNSVAEAMSCELPCVVTNVGDSAYIVDKCGIIVEPNNVESLYNGFKKMIQRDYKKFGILSHKRIEENFSTEKMITRTENLIKEVLA